jgi:hypothetical protein
LRVPPSDQLFSTCFLAGGFDPPDPFDADGAGLAPGFFAGWEPGVGFFGSFGFGVDISKLVLG